jgi:hypothetical protein
MNPKIYLKKFYSFLKKNDATSNFLFNIMTYHKDDTILNENEIVNFLVSEIKEKRECLLIDNAFIWADTSEGFHYWCDLEYKWREEFDKINC